MRYTKPPLCFADQAVLLLQRGLEGIDIDELTSYLSRVNYYRLSAYTYPFKDMDAAGKESFKPGTTFKQIWRRYEFDQALRHLLMHAVEEVEVTILRTQMVEQFSLLHGPFGYTDKANFDPDFSEYEFQTMLNDIGLATHRSSEYFVEHYRNKYREEPYFPLWIVSEMLSFGQLYTIYHYQQPVEKKTLAKKYNLGRPVLDSWLHTLNFVRNSCAHHSRLWNRKLPIEPLLPDIRNRPEWHSPISFVNTRIFCVLTLIQYLLSLIHPRNTWKANLITLLDGYSDIPLLEMGFPDNWHDCPIWD
jgi:abortive infection bacteriophage resistance protein